MTSEVLAEEFEVLESIYPTELTKTSDRDIEISAEPDTLPDGYEPFTIKLKVHYPDGYPDTLPQLSFEDVEDALSSDDSKSLLGELKSAAEENIGMAMTFTLVSLLREKLSDLVVTRIAQQKQEEMEKERREIEAEEARTRGTPVTADSFSAWKANFNEEQRKAKEAQTEAFLKNLSAKERDEWKKVNTRLSGRQLFMKNKDLEDESLEEEGVISVDASQYERNREDDEAEDEGVTFSDSD